MVVTDQRTIFVVVMDPKVNRGASILGGIVGGFGVGAGVAGLAFLMSKRKEIDCSKVDLDGIARTPDAVSIRHSNLRQVRFERSRLSGSSISFEAWDRGLPTRMKVMVSAPVSYLAEQREAGVSRGEAEQVLLKGLRRDYLRILPDTTLVADDWG
jgi:hypothetical protein